VKVPDRRGVSAPNRRAFWGAGSASAAKGLFFLASFAEGATVTRSTRVSAENLISGKGLGSDVVQSRVGAAARGMRLADLKVAVRSSAQNTGSDRNRNGDLARSRSSFDDWMVERSEFELSVPFTR
jgi:hypothetical protein